MNLSEIQRPKVVDKADPRYFEIRTHVAKARKEGDRYFIDGTASSSVEDRYGDLLDNACQASMLHQAGGLTMWLNHSYNVPEDIAGTCTSPTLKNATADDGTPCMDLDIALEIDPENPRAMKCWKHVEGGTKLAFSIGGYFKDFDMRDDFTFEVHDVELLEISLVGIPANPRAYTKNFGISMDKLRAECKKRVDDFVAQPDAVLVNAPAFIRKSFDLSVEDDGKPRRVEEAKELGTEIAQEDAAILAALAEVDGAPEIVKAAVTDPNHCAQIVECMKCIKNCVDCAGHQMCDQPRAHAAAGHAILKAMLPDDYEYPADADLLEAPPLEVKVAVTTDPRLETKLAQLTETVTDLQAQSEQISSEIEQAKSDKDALTAEIAELERKKAELKATPTGRRTAASGSNPDGSPKEGSTPTIPTALYYMSNDEARQLAAAKRAGGTQPESARDALAG